MKQFLFPLLPGVWLLFLLLVPVSSQAQLTKRLFMQTKRANVELPAVDLPAGTPSGGAMTLNESVIYTHQDNSSKLLEKEDSIKQAKSLNDMQYLKTVTVTAQIKQKFAPERNGKVNVDFLVRVPKEMLLDDYRIILNPILLHNDSVVLLDKLILKGNRFIDKQQKDSSLYTGYVNSIIPKSSYDSIYLDRKGIRNDLNKRQEFYYDLYHSQWKKINTWLNYRRMIEERYLRSNTWREGNRMELYHEYKRKEKEGALRSLAIGKDTTGINRRNQNSYNRRIKLFSIYKLHRELTEKNIPKKYRDFFRNNTTLADVKNFATTEKDSVDIARDRYFYHQIARNEAKDKNRDRMHDWMVHFPKKEGAIRLDTVIVTGNDFLYYYQQEYPVTIGLKSLHLTLNGQVVATDRSSYIMPQADTLSYVISSLTQLADTSLVVKNTKVYRNMFDRVTIYPKYEPNQSQFNPNYGDNRLQVDTLINSYRRYTAEMGLQLDSLEITATTSLDGSWDSNVTLSQERSEKFREYLTSHYSSMFSSDRIKAGYSGEDWHTMVRLLQSRKDIVNKDSILSMLAGAVYPDDTEMQIKQRYKKDYKIIQDSIYPLLRKMDLVFHLSRPGMDVTDSIHSQVKDGYQEGLRLLQERDYWGALEHLKNYPDYNTALCLTCMGYNGKAYDLLHGLNNGSINANTEYLLAIISCRMEKEDEAAEHLLKALKLDPNKVYRSEIDTEISDLIRKHDLREKIIQITQNETQVL